MSNVSPVHDIVYIYIPTAVACIWYLSCVNVLAFTHSLTPTLPQVLLTTANWPDVMMPAYTESRWAILFFGLFIVMGVWFIMPVALAVVVQVHQSSETQLKQQAAANRRRGLHAAFMLLDLNRDAQLQFGTVLAVFHELNSDKHNIEFVCLS